MLVESMSSAGHFTPHARPRSISVWDALSSRLTLPPRWSSKLVASARAANPLDIWENIAPALAQERELKRTPLRLDANDDELRSAARALADRVAAAMRMGPATVDAECATVAQRYDVGNPLATIDTSAPPVEVQAARRCALARATDAQHWLRQLRRSHGRHVERAAIKLGIVHKHADAYASRETTMRRAQQQRRNRAALESMVATADDGQSIQLAEIADASVSCPAIKRGELMTRIRGFQEVAVQLRHDCAFITLTCPSRMHARHAESGNQVRQYDGTTPAEASRYLCKVWARIRAALARRGVLMYGFRVAEAHHDGTPHQHYLLWLANTPDQPARLLARGVPELDITDPMQLLMAAFRYYGLQDSPDERGASEFRVKCVRIESDGGGAVAYIAKYIAKSIDGYSLQVDLLGNDIIDTTKKIDAWASTWGIRLFQQIGGPPVGVWRELRRTTLEAVESLDHMWRDAVASVNRVGDQLASWAKFVMCTGGPVVPRKWFPLSLLKEPTDRPTRYGEPAPDAVRGVQDKWGTSIVTRTLTWVLRRVSALGPVSITVRETLRRAVADRQINPAKADPIDAWLARTSATRQAQGPISDPSAHFLTEAQIRDAEGGFSCA